MTDDHYQSLSVSLIEQKLDALRVEWRKSSRSQREILKRKAKALHNALDILKQHQAAIDHPLKDYPKPAFRDSG